MGYVMQILDLKKIENCLVSGISDTDRDKLTIAELALGTYSVMVYDQPLTGSDLAMTYDLVNTIRTVCRIQQSSAVMALNHLSQEALISSTGSSYWEKGMCCTKGQDRTQSHTLLN